MKISELIKELSKIQEESGDLDIVMYDNSEVSHSVPYIAIDFANVVTSSFWDSRSSKIIKDVEIVKLV